MIAFVTTALAVSKRLSRYSRSTSTKPLSFFTTTLRAGLTNLTFLLPQSHDCSCSTAQTAGTGWPTRTRFTHSPDLWHQPRFVNVTCAWKWRLCGINPAITDKLTCHVKLLTDFLSNRVFHLHVHPSIHPPWTATDYAQYNNWYWNQIVEHCLLTLIEVNSVHTVTPSIKQSHCHMFLSWNLKYEYAVSVQEIYGLSEQKRKI